MNKKLFIFLFIIVILTGTGTKLFYAYCLSGHIDGDPASIGLMAQDILEGRFNMFFYGQKYNGALEAYWLAPFVYLFGPKPIVLYYGMIALYILFLLTVYKIGSLIVNKYVGLWAMAYCAVSPYALLHNSVFTYGYHMGLLVLGNIVLILALFIDRNERNHGTWFLLGLCAGLGFWNHFTIVYYLAPAAVFLCLRKSVFRNFKYYITAFLSFLLGSLPFWIDNLQTGFASFYIRSGRPYRYYPVNVSLGEFMKKLFGYHFSGILGIQELNIAGLLVWGVFIIAGIIFTIKLNRKKLLLILFLFSIIGFSFTQKFFVIHPKYCYFIPLYTLIAVWFGYLTDWLNSKLKFSGIVILVFVLIFNMSDFEISISEGRYGSRDKEEFDEKTFRYKSIIDFLDSNKIDSIMADFYTIQAVNFMTDKRIAGYDFIDCRPPTDELVQTRDNLAVLNYVDFFKPTLDVICKDYNITLVDPYKAAYGFLQYGCYGRDILPAGWKVRTNYNNKDGIYGFDRDLDRFWSSGEDKSPGMYYELDLGKIYNIYKLIIVNIEQHLDNLPAAYHIEVSQDGHIWDEVQAGADPKPLFWSGPRVYYDYFNGRWEVYFDPVEARFIRIVQTGFGRWSWMINELFVYECLGERESGIGDYLDSAKKIYQFIIDKNIKFVYADFWLSGKIRLWSEGRIGTLSVVNECYPERDHTDRLMSVDKNTALVVKTQDKENTEKTLLYFGLPIEKEYINDYVCYQFKNLGNWQEYFLRRQKCLYWIGFTTVKTNLYLYSQILTGYGIKNEEEGDPEGALSYYKNALIYYTRNNTARERLVSYYKNKGLYRDYKKELLKLKHLCYPRIEKQIEFQNGVIFLGYSWNQFRDRLRINYYWKIPDKFFGNVVVFVHFNKDEKIAFQGDHLLLQTHPVSLTKLIDQIYVNRTWVDIPPGAGTGRYKINLGLYIPEEEGRRIRINKPGRGSYTVMEIGEIELK